MERRESASGCLQEGLSELLLLLHIGGPQLSLAVMCLILLAG